jgi:thiol-disulfide isomerase/thioredoxin
MVRAMSSRALRLAFLPILVSLAFVSGEDGWERVDRPVEKFEIRNLEGQALSEKAFKGKISVVDFWATWCGPCVQELPELARFAAGLKNRKDVAFLSFSVDDEKDAVEAFFRGRKDRFPVYLAGSIADRMDVMIFPTKLIVDGRGDGPPRVRFRKEGTVEASELEARVAELLKKP